MGKHDKLSFDDRADIVELYYNKKLSISTIAKVFGVSEEHVYMLVKLVEEVDYNE